MNTILIAPSSHATSRGRILGIEPDAGRAEQLRALLGEYLGAEYDIVRTAKDAMRAIESSTPDLVLTSIFLSPAEEAELTDHLLRLPSAEHVQVITVPYLIADRDSSRRTSKVLSFLGRRGALARPCDPDVVAQQIGVYLDQARARRAAAALSGARQSLVQRATFLASTVDSGVPGFSVPFAPRAYDGSSASTRFQNGFDWRTSARGRQVGRSYASDRRRAQRRPAGELPWLWTIKLPSGTEARIVDVSSGGALLETSNKMIPGMSLDLQLIGQDINVWVAARMLRTEIASVDGRGVRYRTAAAFVNSVNISGLGAPQASDARPAHATPAMADLLKQIVRNIDQGAGPEAVRYGFEQGLRRLLQVQDLQIREAPVVPAAGSESIYFTIPRASGGAPILQAIFEPNYSPSANEFKLLKTAAAMAAVVLDVAPTMGATPTLLRP